MPPLNQRRDFRDDGGTPMWRARHARVIDVYRPGFRQWFKRKPLWKLLIIAAVAGYVLPMTALIGGLLLLYIFSKLTGL